MMAAASTSEHIGSSGPYQKKLQTKFLQSIFSYFGKRLAAGASCTSPCFVLSHHFLIMETNPGF